MTTEATRGASARSWPYLVTAVFLAATQTADASSEPAHESTHFNPTSSNLNITEAIDFITTLEHEFAEFKKHLG